MKMTTDTQNGITAEQAKELRAAAGMTQKAFWKTLGCTQTTGSQYESGVYKIAMPVQLLMHAMYVNKSASNAAKVRRAAEKAHKLLGEAING